MQTSRQQERERSAAQTSADRERVREQIERRARMDALDFMQQRGITMSDFTVKELAVSYLDDYVHMFGSPADYGYKADMLVSIKSIVGYFITYRLKLH